MTLWHYIWSRQAVKKELPKIYSRTVIIELKSLIEFIIENIETDLNQQRWLQDFEKGGYKLSKGILQFHKVLSQVLYHIASSFGNLFLRVKSADIHDFLKITTRLKCPSGNDMNWLKYNTLTLNSSKFQSIITDNTQADFDFTCLN